MFFGEKKIPPPFNNCFINFPCFKFIFVLFNLAVLSVSVTNSLGVFNANSVFVLDVNFLKLLAVFQEFTSSCITPATFEQFCSIQ